MQLCRPPPGLVIEGLVESKGQRDPREMSDPLENKVLRVTQEQWVIQAPAELKDQQGAVALAVLLAKLESKEKPDRAASEVLQGQKVSRAQWAAKAAQDLLGTQELLERQDLRAQRVQWVPTGWLGLKVSLAQLETLGLSGLADLRVCRVPRGQSGLEGLLAPRANWATRGQSVRSELEVIRGSRVTQVQWDQLGHEALQARRVRQEWLVQEVRPELLGLEELRDRPERLVREARRVHKGIQGRRAPRDLQETLQESCLVKRTDQLSRSMRG